MSAAEILRSFELQSDAARVNGSAIYHELMNRCGRDYEAGGPVAMLLDGWRGHAILDALPLRLAGAVHAIVLDGRAPDLAAHYPSAGGRFEAEAAWGAFRRVLESHGDEIRPRLRQPLQTNEVRRSAALLPGFLRVARDTGLPLRLLEIGSSAGLNLLWDRYRYQLGPHGWGDPDSPLRLATDWKGPRPDLDARIRVLDRAGCDVAPVDLTDPVQRNRLESFVWPDQQERMSVLRAAMAMVAEEAPRLVRANAGEWVERELAEAHPGSVVVLFQSVMWLYVPESERTQLIETVEQAGARARPTAPLAWLRLEGATVDEVELRLCLWPGGEDRLLASAQYHGRWVHWRG